MKKSGFVAIIGRPNVGKSTLLNQLVGQKLAGVSPKPQTTRQVIRGILTQGEGQVLFLDTPGWHEPQDLLGNWMASELEKSLEGADLIYWVVTPEEPTTFEEKILALLGRVKVPVFLLVNQIDRYEKPKILPVLDRYQKAYPFKELIPISAKKGDQVDLLIQKTMEYLPEGEHAYPDDQISDQNERFLVTEIIREKIYHKTKQEIPYASSVVVEEFKEREDGLAEIHAVIVVERDTQKAIVIGKKGEMAKMIGHAARLDIQNLLGRKVFLKLLVKTSPAWKKDKSSMRELGYE